MKQLALPIECPECGDNRVVGCLCEWEMGNLPIPRKGSPFKIIEKFLGIKEKRPRSFRRLEILPGVEVIEYKV